jgi:uncharacterized protein (TIGR00255 family)
MVQSMTAFARHEIEAPWGSLVWELRTVNHRFLELSYNLPDNSRMLEQTLRDLTRNKLQRGKLDATLRINHTVRKTHLQINRPALLQLLATLEQVRRDAPEFSQANPMDLLNWPGILEDRNAKLFDNFMQLAEESFNTALDELLAARQREGTKLTGLVGARLQNMDRLVNELKPIIAPLSAALSERWHSRREKLKVEVDPNRLEQEIAVLAQRADVAEELDRLAIHVAEARTALESAGPHGRRLDFLTQELNREANTLASKSVLPEASKRAVDLKVLIEQVREQVQNIE